MFWLNRNGNEQPCLVWLLLLILQRSKWKKIMPLTKTYIRCVLHDILQIVNCNCTLKKKTKVIGWEKIVLFDCAKTNTYIRISYNRPLYLILYDGHNDNDDIADDQFNKVSPSAQNDQPLKWNSLFGLALFWFSLNSIKWK